MKKFFAVPADSHVLLCSCAAGCSGQSAIADMSPDAPLVTIDGTVVMTVEDLQRSLKEQEISQQIKGTEVQDEQALFFRESGTSHSLLLCRAVWPEHRRGVSKRGNTIPMSPKSRIPVFTAAKRNSLMHCRRR